MTDGWDGTVDPSRRGSPAPALEGPTLSAVLLEVQCLGVLAGWEPVGSRLQSLIDAVRGVEGISERHVVQLQSWARAWSQLHPRVQAFYSWAVSHSDAPDPPRVALWRIFNRQPVAQGTRWRVTRLWTEHTGSGPGGLEIIPTNL